jgi:hypothetical protein
MKRSEMIELLSQFISYEQGYKEDWSYAEDIIKFLESKGMQPPAYDKLVEAKGIVSPSPEIKLFYKIPCNEWEAE